MEDDLSITLEPMDRFKHMRGPFRVVFQGQSNGTMVQSKLYTSADMQEDLSISLEPMDRFKHMRGPLGVV